MRPRAVPSPNVLNGVCSEVFLGETEGPFLGADLRTGPPGAQAGSRRLRAAGVDALTPPSTRRGWSGGPAGRLSRRRRPPGFRAGR